MSSVTTPARTANPWWVALVCGMASYLDSCSIISMGTALVLYQHSIGITAGQIGWLTGILTFAIAAGALIGGRLGDRLGRRPVFQVTMVFTILGALILMFGTSFEMLLAGTIILGFGTGADLPVSLASISEAATDANRGKLLGLSNILWQVGILGAMAAGIAAGTKGHLGGQIMFAQVAVVAVLVLIARQTIPESGEWRQAQTERTKGVSTERAQRTTWSQLLTPPYLKPLIALFFFYTLVNIGANTGSAFGTYIWVNVVGKTASFGSSINLIVFLLAIILGFAFMRFVDTKWRMPLFYAAMVCQILSYVLPAALGFHTWTMLTNGILGAIGGAFAFEGIMKVWTMERFPTLLRSTAQGNIVAVARFLAGAAAIVTPNLINAGPTRLYWGVAVIVCIGYMFAVWGFGGRQVRVNETAHAAKLP